MNHRLIASGLARLCGWTSFAVVSLTALAAPLRAQQALSLQEALRLALAQNPVTRASQAAESGAAERLKQAGAAYLPTLNYSESLQWGTNPVYVFGSLLEQHRFQSNNFDLQSLNRPDPLLNFASQLTMEQTLFDGNRSRQRLRATSTALDMTKQQTRQSEMDLLAAVTEAYYAAVLAEEELRVAEESLATAEADLERAQALRDSGMATDADVLSLRVSRTTVMDRRIRSENSLLVARARLNDALGAPLETDYALSTPLQPATAVALTLEQLETLALRERPEVAQAGMALTLAQTDWNLARSAFLPEVSVHGVFEANRHSFAAGGGTNWMTGATLRWNLFNGFSDRARIAEASFLRTQREEEQRKITSGLRLQVRQSYLDLQAANSRMDVAQASIAEAEENHRIIANRYEAGLSNATDLLRSQTAWSEAKTRYLAAVFDQRVATLRLERAAGMLTVSSEAVTP
jgi:outer membrane protein TolC